MYRYKNLLIGLSMSDQDESLIRYSGKISHMAKSENVYFCHVKTGEEIPDELAKSFPQLSEPESDDLKNKMDESIAKYFNGFEKTKMTTEIIEGKRLYNFLHFIREKNIDLVIVGRKEKEKSNGSLSERLARKAPCSVLIIPEKSQIKIDKILVALDFSDHAADALDVALAFADAAGSSEIVCLHVYQVPLGYYKTGKSYDEFAKILKNNAQKEYEQFMQNIETRGLKITPLFKLDKNTADAFHKVIKEEHIDLISIGCRGRSASAAILLGSLTERLIWTSQVPVVAVKKKGSGMHLVEALLNL